MGIKRLSDVRAKIEATVANPVVRGNPTGFKCFDELYTVKQGSFTIWHASPAHGKSELIFEVLMNQVEKGEKCALYSPETGTADEIFIELAHKYLQKQIVRYHPINPVASEMDMYNALEWVDHNFLVFDDEDGAYSFEKLTTEIAVFEKENKVRIHQIMAEPYNELLHDMKEQGGRQDLYIEFFLTEVRRYCRANKKHVHLSFHTGSQTAQKQGNLIFYPMPKAREAAGGQAALRKAMTWINLWRPTQGLKDAHGQPYQPNEVLVQVEKAKPKYVSYRGICSLFFDVSKNRFYEKINNIDCFAFDHINRRDELVPVAMPVQVGMDFITVDTPNNVEGDDLPF